MLDCRIKPVTFFLSILVIMSSTASYAFADSQMTMVSHTPIHQLQNELHAESTVTYNQIMDETTKVNTLKSSVQQYSVSLRNVEAAIKENQKESDVVAKQIQQLDQQIAVNQSKLDLEQTSLKEQLRTTYEEGNIPYFSVLLQSASFSDFLTRFDLLVLIMQSQNNLIQSVKVLNNNLVLQEKSRNQEQLELSRKQSDLTMLRQADEILLQKQRNNLGQANHQLDQDLIESQIQLTPAQMQQIQLETTQAEALLQNTAYLQRLQQSLPAANAKDIVSFAESFLGTPYVWGSTGPDGFDCSGFTQYVLGQLGVEIGRTSEEQFAQGIPVDKNALQTGDLVFFSTYAPGATHVGIYIGDGLMIDAEDLGVSIDNINDSYWGPKYIGARRIIR